MLVLCASGCFSGASTLGSICGDDLDCGADQGCSNEVCGRCGDSVPQRGELCLVPATELSSAPVTSPGNVVVLDLENDGNSDLVVRGEDGVPQLWSGDGAGGWSVHGSLTVGGTVGALRLAALDEDGPLDLVVVDEQGPALHLGYGDGEGAWAFEPAVVLPEPPLDVAVASAPWDGPAWIAWVDAQGLQQAVVDAETRTLGSPVTVVPARSQWLTDPVPLDDDEALDLAVADVDGRRIEPWFGDGAGGLSIGAPVMLEARPTEVIARDVDGDGDPDLLVPDEDGGVTVVISDGEGTLFVSERLTVPGVVRWATVADLDRNTERDVVILTDGDAPVWVFLARGGQHRDGIAVPVEGEFGSLVALDGDRDGLTELLLGPSGEAASFRIVEVEP